MADKKKPKGRRVLKGSPNNSKQRSYTRAVARSQPNRALRSETAERRQLEAALLEAHAVIELAMEGISKLDDRGHYVFMNAQYAALLGYRREELIGRSWEITVSSEDRTVVSDAFAHMLAIGRAEAEIRAVKKDGSLIYKHVVIVKPNVLAGKIHGYFCFMRDVTQRKREEVFLLAEKQALELVAQGAGLEEVITFICRTIEAHTAPMLTSIMLVTEDGTQLRCIAAPSLPDEYNRAVDGMSIGPTVGSCGSAAYYGKPSIVTDIEKDLLWTDYVQLTRAHGLRACWSQPILSSTGTVLGTFAAYYKEPRAPTSAESAVIERAGHLAAMVIQHIRMSEALRESEQRHRSVLAAIAEGIVIQDQDGRIRSCNASACRILGLTEDQMVGGISFDPRWRAIHEDGSPFPGDTHSATETLRTGRVCENVVMGVHRPDGSLVWLSINTQPIREDWGEPPTGVVVSFRDITGQKQRDVDLKLFRTLLDQVTDSIEIIDPSSGRFLDGNRQSYESIGYTRDELLTLTVPDIDPVVTKPVFQEYMQHVWEADAPLRIESLHLRKDGTTFPVEVVAQIIHHERAYLVAIVRDITERQQAKAAQRESEERLRALYDDNPSMYFTVTLDGIILSVNRFGAQQLGYQPEELIGGQVSVIVHEEDKAFVRQELAQAFADVTGGVKSLEFRKQTKDGTVIWVQERLRIVRAGEAGLVALIVCEDISARKKMEAALVEREEHLRLFIEHSPVSLAMFDREMRYLAVSRRWRGAYRVGDGPLIGRSHYEIFPEIPERWRTIHRRCLDGAVDCCEEDPFVRADGRIDWIRWEIHPWRTAEGEVGGIIMFTEVITARKQMEDGLRRAGFAMDHAVDAVYWIDRQARILYANDAARAMLGYTADELLGMTVHDLNPDVPPEAWPEWWAETKEKKVVSLEGVHLTKDGRRISIEIRVSFLAYDGREFHCAFVRDIREQRRLDGALRASQERFELAARATNDGIWDWNILTGEQYWSDRHFELFGREPSTLTPTFETWISLVHPDDADRVRHATHHHLETREPYDIEMRVRMNDGSYRWFRDQGQAVWDSTGRPVRMVGSLSDVTERRTAEEALRTAHAELEQRVAERTIELASANRFLEEEILERKRAVKTLQLTQFTVDRAAQGIFWVGPQAEILYVNEAACDVLGYSRAELLNMTVHAIDPNFPPEMWPTHWAELKRRGSFSFESSQLTKDGGVRYTEITVNYLQYDGQEYNCAIVRDITERKRAEEAVRDSELRYKLLTEATFDGIAIHEQGMLLEVNAGLERMFGYGPGELVGRSIMDLVADESHEQVITNMRDGVRGPYEAIGRRKDGTTFPGEIVVRPYRYWGKDVRLVAGRDITERKHLEAERRRYTEELERQITTRTAEITKLESQRAQTERLAAMGRLAAGVAHEINNPIAGIKNAFTLVKQAVDPAHPQYEFVGLIDREISRVSSIVQNMYQLYRRESGKVETVDLRTMIGDIEALFAKQLQQRQLTLAVEMEAGLWRLDVSRSDLLQVLLNLLNNAIDCSYENTVIRLTIREEAEVIRIAVADQGAGISPESLPHIFDPFFTTKTAGDQKGMGLGLSISQSLAMAMGGKIEVRTKVGHGSTFSVLLPRDKIVAHVPDEIHQTRRS